jgi:hypothetical protein
MVDSTHAKFTKFLIFLALVFSSCSTSHYNSKKAGIVNEATPGLVKAPGKNKNYQGDIHMSGPTITIDLPKDPVLSGENFLVTVKVKNTGQSDLEGPPKMDIAESLVFQLAPVNGIGDSIWLSQDSMMRRSPPDFPYEEENFPPPTVQTETYRPGEEIIEKAYPARLASGSFPAGEYNMSVTFEGHSGNITSSTARLVVVPAHIESYHLGVRGVMDGADLIFVHRDPEGRGFLFHGSSDARTPTNAAGLKLAELGRADASGKKVQTSVALIAEKGSGGGGVWCSWLKPDGTFAAAIGYGAYVAGSVSPIDLNLKNSSLLPYGRQNSDNDSKVTFVAMGTREEEIELVKVAIDANKQWSAEITRTPVKLPALPSYWRMIPVEDGNGYIIAATVKTELETQVYSININKEGRTNEKPRLLAQLKEHVLATSVPRLISPESWVHILTTDPLGKAGHLVLHHYNLASGRSKAENLEFNTPEKMDPTDSQWAISEDGLLLTALTGERLTSYKVDTSKNLLAPTVISESVKDGEDLEMVTIGRTPWVLWREGNRAILSRPIL